jgi:hypothetical protein
VLGGYSDTLLTVDGGQDPRDNKTGLMEGCSKKIVVKDVVKA